jgi:mannose-6-phosphate isomerase-like protein (cupin superfamily)
MNFSAEIDKTAVFEAVEKEITDLGFNIDKQDQSRPWGGFLVLDESQASTFIETYFPHLSLGDFGIGRKLSPKILIVAPQKRLSWQYHFRRAEIWKVIGGVAGVVISDTDDEKELQIISLGTIINLRQEERHRLVGLDNWGIIAEIWQHTDQENPSDEEDIVRVQDDFGR